MALQSKPRKYLYMTLTPTMQPGPPYPLGNLKPPQVQVLVEREMTTRHTKAEKIPLINGDIAYRVLRTSLTAVRQDEHGNYIIVIPIYGTFRFVEGDPTQQVKALKPTRDWTPVY